MKQFIEFDLHFKIPLEDTVCFDDYYDILCEKLGFEIDGSKFDRVALSALEDSPKAIKYIRSLLLDIFDVDGITASVMESEYPNPSFDVLEPILKVEDKLDLRQAKQDWAEQIKKHEERWREESISNLKSQAKQLGFKLIPEEWPTV